MDRVGTICLILVLVATGTTRPHAQAAAISDTIVVSWNYALLQAVANTRFAPMLTARALAITHTCMYDAWAAYDALADGVHWQTDLRQPAGEQTQAKAEAISFAAHAALIDLFPSQRAVFDTLLASLGYSTPGMAGTVGLEACGAVLDSRHHDGSNQLGDLHPGSYSDYTGYAPVNTVDSIFDPNRWQPLLVAGSPQQFLTPHWGLVTPFAIASLDDLRPDPPPQYPHGTYIAESNEILHFSARLDDRSKMIAEYWSDGPASVTPPGHWNLFAEAISRRDGHTLDDDAKMFFALNNAMLDASIVVWDCKRRYDSERPVTAIHYLYDGKPIRAWAGPGLGTKLIDGRQFRSYIPTPPFAEYVSGHSTFSAAGAEILAAVTGSDLFGLSVLLPPGSSTIEPAITPAETVTLSWRTYSDAAAEAGLSRRLGGIHFESGDLQGRILGRQIARGVWSHARQFFDGSARVP
jgi:hypothetical protein